MVATFGDFPVCQGGQYATARLIDMGAVTEATVCRVLCDLWEIIDQLMFIHPGQAKVADARRIDDGAPRRQRVPGGLGGGVAAFMFAVTHVGNAQIKPRLHGREQRRFAHPRKASQYADAIDQLRPQCGNAFATLGTGQDHFDAQITIGL